MSLYNQHLDNMMIDVDLESDRLNENFASYSDRIWKSPVKYDNNTLLKLYGLYKQATIGNNKTGTPGFFDIKERAKWNAWKKETGKGRENAKKEYIEYAKKLL